MSLRALQPVRSQQRPAPRPTVADYRNRRALTEAERALLSIVDDLSGNARGYCFAGINYLADALGLGPRQVKRLIKSLNDKGKLAVNRIKGKPSYLKCTGFDDPGPMLRLADDHPRRPRKRYQKRRGQAVESAPMVVTSMSPPVVTPMSPPVVTCVSPNKSILIDDIRDTGHSARKPCCASGQVKDRTPEPQPPLIRLPATEGGETEPPGSGDGFAPTLFSGERTRYWNPMRPQVKRNKLPDGTEKTVFDNRCTSKRIRDAFEAGIIRFVRFEDKARVIAAVGWNEAFADFELVAEDDPDAVELWRVPAREIGGLKLWR